LFTTAGLIILAGFLIFTSVSMAYVTSIEGGVDDMGLAYFLIRQFLFGVLPGILIGLILFKTPLTLIKKMAPVLLLINLILVAMVLVPGLGITIRGAKRWLQVGPISFQPSEFLKLTFILYLSSWLVEKRTGRDDKKIFSENLLAFLAVSGVIAFLMYLQRDLSTLIVIIATGFAMYFIYGAPLRHIAALAVSGVSAFALFIATSPYRLERIRSLIDSGTNPYQAHQALIAIGTGGLFGLGFGMGNQKYGFLPFAMSDSIFAVYAEEAGLVGVIILILLFLIFTWRGFKLAKSRSGFLSLVAAGISFWIFFQAFVHMGAMSGILPITGIPLPFISQGRAHFIAELAGLGIILNISKTKKL